MLILTPHGQFRPVLVLLGVAQAALGASESEVRRFGLAGGRETAWVYAARRDDTSRDLLRFAFRRLADERLQAWAPLAQPVVIGDVRFAAVRRDQLHVLFRDGTHVRYSAESPSLTSTQATVRFLEVNLPPPSLPLALTVDRSLEVLLAVVPERTARKLEAQVAVERIVRDDESAPGGDAAQQPPAPDSGGSEAPSDMAEPIRDRETLPSESASPTPRGTSDSAAPTGVDGPEDRSGATSLSAVAEPSPFWLVRYEGSRWVRDRPLPIEDGSTDILALAADANTVDVIYRGGGGEAPPAWIRGAPGADWTQPRVLADIAAAQWRAAGFSDGALVAVISTLDAEQQVFEIVREREGRLRREATLADAEGATLPARDADEVALAGSVVLVARLGEGGSVQVGAWKATDGRLIEPFAVVSPLMPPPPPLVPRWMTQSVQFVVFLASFATVFLWRRESVVFAVVLEPDQVVAPLTRRTPALLLDMLLISPLVLLAMFLLWQVSRDTSDRPADGMYWESLAGLRSVSVWIWPTYGVVYALYGVVTEGLTRTTPGKHVFQMRVVAEGGGRCTMRAVWIRNLVRMAEFSFPPVILLALMTRNRQRLGDILARTVVVSPSPPPAEPTDT